MCKNYHRARTKKNKHSQKKIRKAQKSQHRNQKGIRRGLVQLQREFGKKTQKSVAKVQANQYR